MRIFSGIVADFGSSAFLEPYFERQLAPEPGVEPAEPSAGVRIVRGDAPQPDAPDPGFEAYCAERALPVAVLVCPSIVCTAMRGLPMRIARAISRGTFALVRGSEARISVVHGSDVARAAARAAGTQGTYVLTDGADPTIAELAQALAHRLGDKRLITISPRLARIWYGRQLFGLLTTDHCQPSTFAEVFPDFKPEIVTQYLRTHVYDQESL